MNNNIRQVQWQSLNNEIVAHDLLCSVAKIVSCICAFYTPVYCIFFIMIAEVFSRTYQNRAIVLIGAVEKHENEIPLYTSCYFDVSAKGKLKEYANALFAPTVFAYYVALAITSTVFSVIN